MRNPRGQAALEYAGALLLVAVVLGVAAAAAPLPALGSSVLAQLRLGLCRVTGSVCTSAEARADGLAPCTVRSRSNREDAGVSVGVVRLGRGDALAIERRSDGTATVSFLDGWEGGAAAGIGVRFTPIGLEGSAQAGGGLTFTGGRSWDFTTWAQADAFVGRYARHETLTGEVRDRLCFFCGEDDPPPAHAVVREGGAYGEAGIDAGVEVGGRGATLAADVRVAATLGHRTAGSRRTTYVRLSGESLGRLGAVFGSLATDGSGSAVLEYTTEAGAPAQMRVLAAAGLGAQLEGLGAAADLGRLADALKGARAGTAGGSGLAAEASVSLDLRDPANLDAARGVLAALRAPWRLGSALSALGSRMDSDGTLDVGVHRAGVQRDETAAEAALGLKFGAAYERVEAGRELIAAWTSNGGGPLREREDCAAATGLAGQA